MPACTRSGNRAWVTWYGTTWMPMVSRTTSTVPPNGEPGIAGVKVELWQCVR